METRSTNQLNPRGVDREIEENTEKYIRKTWKPKLESVGSLTTDGGQVTQFIF